MAARRRYDDDDGFHLDRRIPVALLVGGVVQAGVFVFGYASLTSDVRHLAQRFDLAVAESKESRKKLEILPSIQVEIKFWSEQHQDLENLVRQLLSDKFTERSRLNARRTQKNDTR